MAAPKTFLEGLTATQQAIATAAALVLLGGGCMGWAIKAAIGAQVDQVAADAKAFDSATVSKDAEQDRRIEQLDDENELQFQNDVRMSTKLEDIEKKVDWSNQALYQVTRDAGLRVPPPPSPSPSPSPSSPGVP